MHHPIRRLPAASLAMALLLASSGPASRDRSPGRGGRLPAYDSDYHTYPEMVDEIKSTEAAYPDIVALRSIGSSYKGRTIWAAKVSDRSRPTSPSPRSCSICSTTRASTCRSSRASPCSAG